MKKIKYYLAIITLCIATLMITETLPLNLGTYTVQAKASTSTKRKAQKAYRKLLHYLEQAMLVKKIQIFYIMGY